MKQEISSSNQDQTAHPALEAMAQQLRATRQAKGLSQRALGKRSGLPQSHISQIENAGADIRTTSLLTLAHALDLELALVPRRLIPVIESLKGEGATASGLIPQEVMRTLSEIDALESLTSRILNEFDSEDFSEAQTISILHETLRDMTRIHMSTTQAKELQDRIKLLKKPLNQLKSLLLGYKTEAKRAGNYKTVLKKSIGTIATIAAELRDIRNLHYHNMSADDMQQRPAYQLDEEEDDG